MRRQGFGSIALLITSSVSVSSFCSVSRTRPTSQQAAVKKDFTASEREKRDEEQRRQERKADVVIGKTSALSDAKDFELNPKATEEEWLRQASENEKLVFHARNEGMNFLKMFRIKEASAAFDRVFQIKPDAYLWQAGIAKFYQKEYLEAATILARNIATFESKFGSPATEERIWRAAAQLKYQQSLTKKELKDIQKSGGLQKTFPQVPVPENDETPVETRKTLKLVQELFQASLDGEASAALIAQATLRGIAGEQSERPTPDKKLWKLTAWYYLGLHYDCVDEVVFGKECMKMAIKLCPNSGKADDILYTLPMMHMTHRDWFDDEEFDETPPCLATGDIVESISFPGANPIMEKSIREGIAKMTLEALSESLKLRGIKTAASRDANQERLFVSLMEDAGFKKDLFA